MQVRHVVAATRPLLDSCCAKTPCPVSTSHPSISLRSHTTQGARNLQSKQMRTSLREAQSWGPDRRKDSVIPWLQFLAADWVVVQIHVRDLAKI